MRKKRILFHSEFSGLSSGFSIYTKNLIDRLYNSNKYEIAEFADYVKPDDPRLQYVPWSVFPVMPYDQDEEYKQQYNSHPLGQFGLFKFEQACVVFKPDIVISIFDYWYSSYINKSPYRDFFKFMWMPTVDSKPQRPCWIDAYSNCDKILAYSYFGKEVLEDESGGRIKNIPVASPGIDDTYTPSISKEEMRKNLGIPQDMNIVMMVCRNQMRKLIPDFLETLPLFIEKYKKKNRALVDRTFFYIHTSNPDSGWDLCSSIVRTGCADKILTTYICKSCGSIGVSMYHGLVGKCYTCGQFAAHMTSVSQSIPRQALADLMHMSDIGVLMSIGEGWGMPLVEFKKVGTPVIAVPYSAMKEQCVDIKCGENRHWGGIPVKIDRFYTEAATMQERALFDREDFAKQIYQILALNETKRRQLSEDAKRCVDTYFTWDRAAEIWMDEIDKIDISDNLDWETTPPRFIPEITDQTTPPDELSNNPQMIASWCAKNWYPHPYWTDYRINELINCLVSGANMIDQFNKAPFNFDIMRSMFKEMVDKHNFFEKIRMQLYQDKNKKQIDTEEISVIIV